MDLGQVALAIHDVIPVALAAAALAMIAGAIRNARPAAYPAAATGGVLVVLGGATKAVAKLLDALAGDVSLSILDEALFPLLAPGMLLLAAAATQVRRREVRRPARHPALTLLVVWAAAGLVAATVSGDAAKALLIGLATVGNLVLGIALIRWSASLGLRRAAVLYAINLGVVVGLAGMARVLDQTTTAQWIEQNVNLLGQLAFLLASRQLSGAAARVRNRTSEIRL